MFFICIPTTAIATNLSTLLLRVNIFIIQQQITYTSVWCFVGINKNVYKQQKRPTRQGWLDNTSFLPTVQRSSGQRKISILTHYMLLHNLQKNANINDGEMVNHYVR